MGFGHQGRALLDQTVGALAARIERRAGHRENLAALFGGHPRGDQRAGAARRFDHHDAERQPGDQPVAAGKVAGARLPAERHFRDRGAVASRICAEQVDMLGRIDAVVTAGEHRDGAGRRGWRDAPRRRCRARARRRWRKPASPSSRASWLGEFHAGGRGVARADDGDHRPISTSMLAAHREQRRRIVDHPQPRRIIRLAERDEARRRCAARRSSSGSASAREQIRPGACAPPRRARSGSAVERRARAAEMIDQGAEGARPDIVAADQAQPVEPLVVGELSLPPRRQHAARRSRLIHRRGLFPILAFGAGHQPRDVVAVHDRTPAASAREQRGVRRLAEPPQDSGVSDAGDQRRQRRVAGDRGDREPDRAEDSAAGQEKPISTPI